MKKSPEQFKPEEEVKMESKEKMLPIEVLFVDDALAEDGKVDVPLLAEDGMTELKLSDKERDILSKEAKQVKKDKKVNIILDTANSIEKAIEKIGKKDYDIYFIDALLRNSSETTKEETYSEFEKAVSKNYPAILKKIEEFIDKLSNLVEERPPVKIGDGYLDKDEFSKVLSCGKAPRQKEIPSEQQDSLIDWNQKMMAAQGGVRLFNMLKKKGVNPILFTSGFDHGSHTWIYALVTGAVEVDEVVNTYRDIKEKNGIKKVGFREYLTTKVGISKTGNIIVGSKSHPDSWRNAIQHVEKALRRE